MRNCEFIGELLRTRRIVVLPDEGRLVWGPGCKGRAVAGAEPYLFVHNSGYWAVQFGRRSRTVMLHHIVWFSVNGPIPAGLMIDHANRNRLDCRISNLRLVDSEGNAANRPSQRGERSIRSRHTNEQRRAAVARVNAGEQAEAVAAELGIASSTMARWKQHVAAERYD